MTDVVPSLDDLSHDNIDLVLPWFVNDTLEDAERAWIARHVQKCVRCQHEVRWLREVGHVCRAAGPGRESGPQRRRPAMNTQRRWRSRLRALTQRWQSVAAWAQWTMVAELAAVVALGLLYVRDFDSAPYHTLGPATAAHDHTVVVAFHNNVAESELRRILRESGAYTIDPPTAQGGYVLHVPRTIMSSTIERLGKEPAVRLVEPLVAEPRQ